MQTHALIGLTDLTARYPIPAVEAAELLERWCEEGKVVRIGEDGGTGESRWAERGNLTEMRRATVAARRRESLAVQPEVFADFLLRRQHVHTAIVGEGAAAVERVLEQLQGYGAAASLWENEILPRRVKGYRPAWLDEVLAQGNWFWRAEGEQLATSRESPFSRVNFPAASPMPGRLEDLTADEARVLDLLDQHGASFAVDLARLSGLEPSLVRGALKALMRRGLATNDRFDPVRAGADKALEALSKAGGARRAGLSLRPRAMRALAAKPEGRWWRLPALPAEDEPRLLRWADILLERYGVLTREVVALEPSAPKWPQLAPLLVAGGMAGRAAPRLFRRGAFGLAICNRAGSVRARPSGRGDQGHGR